MSKYQKNVLSEQDLEDDDIGDEEFFDTLRPEHVAVRDDDP